MIESVEQFLNRGGSIRRLKTRKPKTTKYTDKQIVSRHMSVKSETHAWWKDGDNDKTLEATFNAKRT